MSVTMSPTIAALSKALSKAQASITAAAKDKTNPHFKSQYADLASVWEACRDQLTANDLAVTQHPSAEGATVAVATVLSHSSGEWIQSELRMVARDASPQSIGSAITYARRYALAAIAGVAPDDDDGEAAQPPRKGQMSRPAPTMPARVTPPPAAPPARVTADHAGAVRFSTEMAAKMTTTEDQAAADLEEVKSNLNLVWPNDKASHGRWVATQLGKEKVRKGDFERADQDTRTKIIMASYGLREKWEAREADCDELPPWAGGTGVPSAERQPGEEG